MKLELKIQEDAFDRAEALAAELRIDAPTALGHAMYMWWWAVRVLRPTPTSAPNGIITGRAAVQRLEAAARWKGAPGRLVRALMDLGLIARVGKKMRVKGTEPYAREQRRKEKARARERQRRAEKKKLLDELRPKKPQLVKPEASKEAIAFWHWMMHERAQDKWKPGADPFGPRDGQLDRAGVSMDKAPPQGFGRWYAERMDENLTNEQLSCAWLRFLGDEHFRTRRWPVLVFMTEGIFRSRLTA